MFLIVGATGKVGSEICRLLSNYDQPVKALIRETSNPDKVKYLSDLGINTIIGDLRDKDSLNRALVDVETVISTVSSMPFSYLQGENDIRTVDLNGMETLVDLSKNAGVKHFIYTSFSGQINLDFPLQTAKRKIENHIKKSGIKYTILRPGYYMETWLSNAVGFDHEYAKAKIYGTGTNPVSYISYKDVAKFAILSLKNPDAINSVFELGGPQKLNQLEAVKIFEDIMETKFELQIVSEEDLNIQYKQAVDPMQKSFVGLMLSLAKGDPIEMRDILQYFPVNLISVKTYAQNVLVHH